MYFVVGCTFLYFWIGCQSQIAVNLCKEQVGECSKGIIIEELAWVFFFWFVC